MADEKEALYSDKHGPLGPEKFENDLDEVTREQREKAFGPEFMKEMDDIVARILADNLAQEKKL
jgi:hypothetical protein